MMNKYVSKKFNRQLTPLAQAMLNSTIKEIQNKDKLDTYIKNIKPNETLEFEIDGIKYRLTGPKPLVKEYKKYKNQNFSRYIESCKVLEVLNPKQLLFINGKSNGRYLNEEMDCLIEVYSMDDIKKAFKTEEDYQNYIKENDVWERYLIFEDASTYVEIINEINCYASSNPLYKYENALLSAIYTLIFYNGEQDEQCFECVLGVLSEGLEGIDKYFIDKTNTNPEYQFYKTFKELNDNDKEIVLERVCKRVAEFIY